MKNIVLLVFLFTTTLQLFAQTDSIALKTEIAFADAKHFRINKQIFKVCRKKLATETSDYFKPNEVGIQNKSLLQDSDYVKAYKIAAYNRTLRQIKLNKTIIITGGIVIVGIVALYVLIIKALGSAFSDIGSTIS
jgi:hypothetical protein